MEENYGFEKIELASLGGMEAFANREHQIVIAKCNESAVGELETTLENEHWQEACKDKYREVLSGEDYALFVLLWSANEEVNVLVLSKTKKTRSLEFVDYLITEFGLAKGDEACAVGRVAMAILKVQMAEDAFEDYSVYFQKKIAQYFATTVCIDAGSYASIHRNELESMPIYYKKRIPWAYVRSTDVVNEGVELFIRSLENTSGFTITASEDVYIMIGSRGEIYDIKKDKFENSYEPSEEKLDIFEQILEFLPAVEILPDKEYVALDEQAKLCYPKKGAGIKATQLKNRTKIFPDMENGFYHLGNAGDYMAVRLDDEQDMYVIQGDIFERTYEAEDTV